MKSTLECVPCFVGHALEVAKIATDCPERQETILRQALRFVADMNMNDVPPAMAKRIHQMVNAITGVDDPYVAIKDESTAHAKELFPEVKKRIAAADDAFEATVRAVIAGNIIDFGANRDYDLSTVRHTISAAFDDPLDLDALATLKRKMEEANSILYVLDNCGEAVFDALLIEMFKDKITAAVRGEPILNDVTLRESAMSGIDDLVKVISNGDKAPGTIVENTSEEFQQAFNSADLIIAKGQGNFETLSETTRPIAFLLKVKCPVVADRANEPVGSLVIKLKNL